MFETPWLYICWEEHEYLSLFKTLYWENNIVNIPEYSKPLFVYTNKDPAIYHIWRWLENAWLSKEVFSFDNPKFWRRSQRIWWIKYILENKEIRTIYRDKSNWYLCFTSYDLEYTVVLKELPKSFLLITAFHTFDINRYFLSDKFEKVLFN